MLDRVESTDVGDEEPEVTGGVDAWPLDERSQMAVHAGIDAAGQTVSSTIGRNHRGGRESRSVVGRGSVGPVMVHVFDVGIDVEVPYGLLQRLLVFAHEA